VEKKESYNKGGESKMKKGLSIILTLFSILLLSGCWDNTEIEEIGFIMGVAFDTVSEEEKEKAEKERAQRSGKHEMFKVTLQIARPSVIQTKTGQGGGGGGESPFFNVASTDFTNFKIKRNFSSRISRNTNLEHLKSIVISEDLIRQEAMLEHLIDFYLRDDEMRRNPHVLVSKGKASNIFTPDPKLGDIPAIAIQSIGENYPKVLPMQRPKELGEVSKNIIENQSFLIPRIVKHGNGLKIAGAAIFKPKPTKMVGWLGEEDVAGFNLVKGKVINEIIEAEYKEQSIVFEIQKMNSSVRYHRDENKEKDTFEVNIKAEGFLSESWLHAIDVSEPKILKEIETAVNKEIEKMASTIIEKMQNEFHVDVFEFGAKVKRENYPYWQKAKQTWDAEDGGFSKADIQVTANVKIRHYMLNEKLKKE
jgi:spore germination protein